MKQILLGMAFLLTAPAATRAEPGAPQKATTDMKAMYEDIEVMRRLLARELNNHRDVQSPWLFQLSNANDKTYTNTVNKGLQWLGAQQGLGASSSDKAGINTLFSLLAAGAVDGNTFYVPPQVHSTAAIPFEGIYLKGHGVAFTATIPFSETVVLNTPNKSLALLSGCGKCHTDQSVRTLVTPQVETTPKSSSAWEQMQKEVRGISEPAKSQADAHVRVQDICSPGNLTEIYLKLFAENGFNFKQLPAGEYLTVAITFGEPGKEGVKAERLLTASIMQSYQNAFAAAYKTAEEVAALGDLHAKQHKHDEAMKCYSDAIKRLESQPLTFHGELSAAAAKENTEKGTRLLRNAYTKQAQELLALGKLNEARAALDKGANAIVKLGATTNSSAATNVAASTLPAKLIMCVSKKSLDDVHAGTIDMEQFKKQADVQTINFPAADKKK